ncbi:MAG: hypothetical protein ACT4O1_04650 [Gemmatimonadota bacterium]
MKRSILVLALLMLAACDKGRNMETRTYQLSRLTTDDALSLLTPYIREDGRLSGRGQLITVREAPDRLTVIEDMLKKYDGLGQAVDVVLTMQIIWANGYEERDSAIADIEGTLREMFKFRGYRLAGETRVQAREDSDFAQVIPGYELRGRVMRIRQEGDQRRLPIEVMLRGEDHTRQLVSTVTATIGKPVVLGQSGGGGAIILVIRPSLAGT